MMRGDLLVNLRLLGRPGRLLGLAVAVLGVLALVATYLPWYEVSATLDLLGRTRSRTLAGLAGWEAQPWSWVVPLASLGAAAVGVGLAVDRPPPRAGLAATAAGMVLVIAAIVASLVTPPVASFDVAGSRLRGLSALRLPDAVALDFAVTNGIGLWVTAAAGAGLAVAGLAQHLRR